MKQLQQPQQAEQKQQPQQAAKPKTLLPENPTPEEAFYIKRGRERGLSDKEIKDFLDYLL